MLKKHMAACLVATAFAVAPALAQQSTPSPSGATDRPTATGTGTTTSGSSAMQPNATGSSTAPAGTAQSQVAPPATPAPTGSNASSTVSGSKAASTSASNGMQGKTMTHLQGEQMLASELIGTSVISTNNESIGDVNDVVLDRNGQTVAVVVGVGGFLGIGEKDVAVPFSALDFNAAPGMASVNTPSSTGSTASSQQDQATNRQTATTGNTGNAGRGAAAGAVNSNDNDGGVPERIVLKMTKAELQAAPAFRSSNRADDAGTSTPKQ